MSDGAGSAIVPVAVEGEYEEPGFSEEPRRKAERQPNREEVVWAGPSHHFGFDSFCKICGAARNAAYDPCR